MDKALLKYFTNYHKLYFSQKFNGNGNNCTRNHPLYPRYDNEQASDKQLIRRTTIFPGFYYRLAMTNNIFFVSVGISIYTGKSLSHNCRINYSDVA